MSKQITLHFSSSGVFVRCFNIDDEGNQLARFGPVEVQLREADWFGYNIAFSVLELADIDMLDDEGFVRVLNGLTLDPSDVEVQGKASKDASIEASIGRLLSIINDHELVLGDPVPGAFDGMESLFGSGGEGQ